MNKTLARIQTNKSLTVETKSVEAINETHDLAMLLEKQKELQTLPDPSAVPTEMDAIEEEQSHQSREVQIQNQPKSELIDGVN